MTVITAKQERRFTTTNGDRHLIDSRGNHFINGRCVNPCLVKTHLDVDGEIIEIKDKGEPIGSTYPPEHLIVK